jgi:dihydropteroate synthase
MPDSVLQSTFSPPSPFFLRAGSKTISLERPVIMGILNLSSDSFFAGSRMESLDMLVKQAAAMLEDGASILDLGALSSRPGSSEISEKEEISLLIPGIRALRMAFPEALLSADVFRSEVAEAALSEGADIINNIGGAQSSDKLLKTI